MTTLNLNDLNHADNHRFGGHLKWLSPVLEAGRPPIFI